MLASHRSASHTCHSCSDSKTFQCIGLRQHPVNAAFRRGVSRKQHADVPLHNGALHSCNKRCLVMTAAAKGFGKVKPALSEPNAGCPCGSGKFYKVITVPTSLPSFQMLVTSAVGQKQLFPLVWWNMLT